MNVVRIYARACALLLATGAAMAHVPIAAHAEEATQSSSKAKAHLNETKAAKSAGRAAATLGLKGDPALFAAAAKRHGVPMKLALSVIMVESSGRCQVRGSAGELGPLQIKLATARGLGYRGSPTALRSCGAGLEWGMKHLALAYNRCGTAVLHQVGLNGSCRTTGYTRKVERFISQL